MEMNESESEREVFEATRAKQARSVFNECWLIRHSRTALHGVRLLLVSDGGYTVGVDM
jgi:hypothetical protein